MKHLLKKGKISLLLSETGGGLSGEVHLVTHCGEKYLLRKCAKLEKAKTYEEHAKRFEKLGFLPKMLGRFGKNVLYEYVGTRDARDKESPEIFRKIGKIAAQINKFKQKGDVDKRFKRQIEELVTGKFAFSGKVIAKRAKLKVYKKPEPVFSRPQADKILKVYELLKKKAKPTMALDINDVTKDNFRIGKNNKVHFVDIEAIKPRIKGFGIAKFFIQWGDTEQKRKNFLHGYASISSTKFLTEEYLDFLFLNFLMQRINYNVNIFQWRGYKKALKKLNKIVDKYS